jgi:hypothetical protein
MNRQDQRFLEALKKKKKDEDADESMPASTGAPLYRGKKKNESRRIWEAADATGAIDSIRPLLEGSIVKVVLLTEGLGNTHDMNYYGPEAVNSMPKAFEGAPCMLNHLSYSQEEDRPEGEVEKTVGYYKNLRVETVGGKMACVGELHFDLSSEGWNAFNKAKTAIHYKSEFPMLEREYVGLSVNAAGESEEREMVIDGQPMTVHYVLKFDEARSCDMVTLPARGGKFVDLVESMAGSQSKHKEVRIMIVKQLGAAKSALKEAQSEKDSDLRTKKISEAQTAIDSLLKKFAEEASRRSREKCEDEDESESEDESEGEDESEAEGDLDLTHKAEDEDASDGDDGAGDGDSHTIKTLKVVRKTGKAAIKDDEDEQESRRLAIKALVGESGITKEAFDMPALLAMPFREAKAKIAETKRLAQYLSKKILESVGSDVSAGHGSKFHEAGSGSRADNTAEFADLAVI